MENHTQPALPITAWATDDRPREKLQHLGKHALSDAELLAILLGSGSPKESAVALAQRILQSVDNNLHQLGKRSLAELMKFKGIGEAKAITIAAAMELGRRRQASPLGERPAITSSREAYLAIAPSLMDLAHEEMWMLLLNKSNRLIGKVQVSIGGMDSTVVDGKTLFRRAIEGQAAAIVLCHNHPSGVLKPSQADLNITKKIKESGEILGVNLFDHLIIGDNGYFSFADSGVL